MTHARLPMHGRDHRPGGADPIPNWPTGGGTLASAVLTASTSQGVTGISEAQVNLDSTSFATTDATVFDVGTNQLTLLQTGLYLGLLCVRPEGADLTTLQDAYAAIRWSQGTGTAQISPRSGGSAHDTGGNSFRQTSTGADFLVNTSWAFITSVAATVSVKVFLDNLTAGTITVQEVLLTVIQLQAISDFTGWPNFPATL